MAWFALAKRLTLPFARPLPRPFTGKCWAASSGFWKCLFRLRTQTESLESDKPNVYRVIAKVGAVLLRKIQKFNHREPFSVWPLWSSSWSVYKFMGRSNKLSLLLNQPELITKWILAISTLLASLNWISLLRQHHGPAPWASNLDQLPAWMDGPLQKWTSALFANKAFG